MNINTNVWEILFPQKNGNMELLIKMTREWRALVRTIDKDAIVYSTFSTSNHQLFSEDYVPIKIICTDSKMDKVVNMTKLFLGETIHYYKVSDTIYSTCNLGTLI